MTLDRIWLHRMELSQSKYKDGALYQSIVNNDNGYLFYDVRFYFEDGDILNPTKFGFRIRLEMLGELHDNILLSPYDVDFKMQIDSSRELIGRYNDKYGKGVDFRYYVTTNKYTGWDKRGIKFSVADYPDFTKSAPYPHTIDYATLKSKDLFREKRVVSIKKNKNKRRIGTQTSTSQQSTHVHDAVDKILKA